MPTRRPTIALAVLTLLGSFLAGTVAVAQESGEDGTKKKPVSPLVKATSKPKSETKVWTNEDLAKLAGSGSETPPTLPPAPAPATPAATPSTPTDATPAADPADPLQALKQAAERRAERQKEIASAEQALADAEANVVKLEKQSLAVTNPFLARPKVAQDQAAAWQKMSAAERAEHTKKQLDEARAAVDRARAALDAVRRGQ